MRDETAWLADGVGRQIAKAKGDAEQMARNPEEAVHALRVRMKRLRALLRLGKGAGGALNEMEAHCRSIQQGLSQSRDGEMLRKLHWKVFDQAPVWQGGRVAKGWSVAKVKREVDRLIRLAEDITLGGLTWERVQTNFLHSLKQAKKAAKRCEDAEDAATFHTLRKRVKVLLYQSQALPKSRGVKKRIQRAKALGKRLGREHDLAVLNEKLASHGGDAERQAQVERLRLRLHNRVREKAAKLLQK
jgi:CHAD domain-containing protein